MDLIDSPPSHEQGSRGDPGSGGPVPRAFRSPRAPSSLSCRWCPNWRSMFATRTRSIHRSCTPGRRQESRRSGSGTVRNPFLCEVWRFRMILEEVWHQGTLLVGRSLSLDSIDLGDPPKNCKMGGVGSFGSSFLLEFSWLLKVCVEPLSFFWGLVMRVLGHNFHLVVWIE